jgi:transcriptional regulator with XRE-family HTH domain
MLGGHMGGVRPPSRPGGPGTFAVCLRERRLAAGFSLSELSAEVHYSKSELSKIENGTRRPTTEFARRCDVILGARGELAALVPAAAAVSPARAAPADAQEAHPFADPGEFESWLREPPAAAAVPTPRAPGAGALTILSPAPDLVTLEATFHLVRDFGRATSPRSVLPLAVGLLHAVRSELASGGDRGRLLRLGARVAMFTGWMAQEAGEDQAAVRWSDLAAGLAEADGDTSFVHYARVRKALIALYRGDAGQAVTLAAATRSGAGVDPGVRKLAAQREAQGYALAGDERACLAALETASSFGMSVAGGDDEPWFGSAAVPDMTELVAGWCLYDLGRLTEAEARLDFGLRRVPEEAYRARARFAVRLALAQVAGGDLDRACDTMALVLSGLLRTDSATIRTDVAAFSRQLGRWRGHPAVRELQPAITAVLLSRPVTPPVPASSSGERAG